MCALETFAGQLPNVGYNIEQFPEAGFVGGLVSLFMSDVFDGKPDCFALQIRSLPEIEIQAR